jgi:hypothetical protein
MRCRRRIEALPFLARIIHGHVGWRQASQDPGGPSVAWPGLFPAHGVQTTRVWLAQAHQGLIANQAMRPSAGSGGFRYRRFLTGPGLLLSFGLEAYARNRRGLSESRQAARSLFEQRLTAPPLTKPGSSRTLMVCALARIDLAAVTVSVPPFPSQRQALAGRRPPAPWWWEGESGLTDRSVTHALRPAATTRLSCVSLQG